MILIVEDDKTLCKELSTLLKIRDMKQNISLIFVMLLNK